MFIIDDRMHYVRNMAFHFTFFLSGSAMRKLTNASNITNNLFAAAIHFVNSVFSTMKLKIVRLYVKCNNRWKRNVILLFYNVKYNTHEKQNKRNNRTNEWNKQANEQFLTCTRLTLNNLVLIFKLKLTIKFSWNASVSCVLWAVEMMFISENCIDSVTTLERNDVFIANYDCLTKQSHSSSKLNN